MLIALFFLLMTLVAIGDLSGQIISYKIDGLVLEYNDLKSNFYDTSGTKHPVLYHPEYTITHNKNIAGYTLQTIITQIATPDELPPTVKIKNIKLKFLDKIKLLKYNDTTGFELNSAFEKVEPKVVLKYLGIQRGVNVYLIEYLPYYYINDSLYISDSVSIEVIFHRNSKLKQETTLSREDPFYANLINTGHITPFKNHFQAISKDHSDEVQTLENWYNPDIDYIKIETTKDGIAIIRLADVLKIYPQWRNKQSKYLHLIHFGREYPFIILNDNGIINDTDSIIFKGLRPLSDTSWIDYISTYEPFYLYYDEASEGTRLKIAPKNIATIDYDGPVIYDIHIEEDEEYWEGKDIADFNTSSNEGYYWRLMDQNKDNLFEYDLFLMPSNMQIENLTISLKTNYRDSAYSVTQGRWVRPYYHLQYSFNDKLIQETQFNEKKQMIFSNDKSNSQIYTGINRVKFHSLQSDPWKMGMTLVDYFKIRGNQIPFAKNGESNFLIEQKNNNIKIEIPGFSANNIIGIDTLNNLFFLDNESKDGTYFVINATWDRAFISLNHQFYHSELRGYHFAYLTPDNFKEIKTLFFSSYNEQLFNFLDTIQSGAIIAGIYNGAGNIPQKLQNLLTDLGLSKFKGLNNAIWTFAIQKFGSFLKENIEESNSLVGFIQHSKGNSYLAKFNFESNKNYHLFFNDQTKFEYPTIKKVESTTLKTTDFNSELVIITFDDFYEQAERLSQHRQNTNKINVAIAKIDEIYKEFNYGKKSPYALKSYLKHIYQSWNNPAKYILLFGDASFDPHMFLEFSKRIDYIPSFGWPVTDYWYALLEGNDFMPEMVVTRLPISSIQEAKDVVTKIIFYDTIPFRPWMKKFLWLSGGITPNERERFYETRIPFFFDYLLSENICGDTVSVQKRDPAIGGEMESNQIKQYINQGTQWTCYLGHASVMVYDMDGWQVERLNNKGRYGFYTTISCSSGDYGFSGENSRNETYLLAPERGFVAAAGGSTTSNYEVDRNILWNAMKHLTRDNQRNFSDIIYHGKTKTYDGSIWTYRGLFYFQILGDPLSKFKIDTVPDLYLLNSDITILSENNSQILDESNQYAVIKGKIHNAGTKFNQPVKIRLVRDYENNILQDELLLDPICLNQDFEFILPIQNMPGKHKLTIVVNPDNEIGEFNLDNNIINVNLDVFTTGLLMLDPLPFWSVSIDNPKFRFINPHNSDGLYKYFLELSNHSDFGNILYSSLPDEIKDNEVFIEWQPNYKLSNQETYWVRAKHKDINKDGKESSWIAIPFRTTNEDLTNKAKWSLVSNEQFNTGTLKTIEFDESLSGIRLKQVQQPFIAFGLHGTENATRYSRISINEIDYVNQEWARGFNIVTINMYTGKGRYKQFDTWLSPTTCEDLVLYLKDSISTDEYLLIATNDPAFWTPFYLDPKEPGYIDSISSALQLYGVTVTDQFKERASFAMFGWKYAHPDSILQMVNQESDTAIVSGFLTIYDTTGTYSTQRIGPAKKWNKLKINGYLSDILAKREITINAIRDNGIIDNIKLPDNSSVNDISFINSEFYQNIQLVIDLSINDRNTINYINSIELDFVPADELAIIKSLSDIKENEILRGYPNEFLFTIRNISPRVIAEPTFLNFEIHSLLEEILYERKDTIKALNPDEIYNINGQFSTKNLLSQNKFYFQIDKHQRNIEFYRINNSYQKIGYIAEDTIKPSAIIYADDMRLYNYEWVRLNPVFRIEIFDNSPLGISDNLTKVRLNGKIITKDNSNIFNFTEILDNTTLKAILEFQPKEPLDYTIITGELQPKGNLLITYLSDKTGNRDTLFNYINVSRDVIVEDVLNFPNPFENNTKIKFQFKSPDGSARVSIDIFDIYGKKIRTLSLEPIIGNNEIQWDRKDRDGKIISAGVYIYRLSVESEYYTEPIYGKMYIIR